MKIPQIRHPLIKNLPSSYQD